MTARGKNLEDSDKISYLKKQVFITMPAKAAGTSMIVFTQKCSPVEIPFGNLIHSRDVIEKISFTDNYDVPSVIASHLYTDRPFVDLVKSSTRETLIIYSHREESSRVPSAIQMVLMYVCTGHKAGQELEKKYYNFTVEVNKKTDVPLMRNISSVSSRVKGAPRILTCNFFDSISQNDPSNLVFVHYKQATKLQTILAKNHCPHIVKDLPIAINVAANLVLIVPRMRPNG